MSRYIATALVGWMAMSVMGSHCIAADVPATQAATQLGDSATANPQAGTNANGTEDRHFESALEGIAFTAPPTCKKVPNLTPDGIVAYASDKKGWTITVSRMSLPTPQPLNTMDGDKGKVVGVADQLLDRTRSTLPGATVLRNDPSNSQRQLARMIVIRYGPAEQTRLLQQAIIQANAREFYTVQMVSESTSRTVLAEDAEDPAERQAADAFSVMFDSIRIIDRSMVRQEQDDRLLQTRLMLVNFNAANIEKKLQKERYLRFELDGRDVGWEFDSEEMATHGNLAGVRIWKASYLSTGAETHQEQILSSFASFDRNFAIWERRVALFDGKNFSHFDEVGTADHSTELQVTAPDVSLETNDAPGEKPKRPSPRVIPVTRFVLNVSILRGSTAEKPQSWELPKEYLSECLEDLLPRILAGNNQKGYMFVGYVSQRQSPMLRYFDSLGMQKVTIDHTPLEAYVISDRIGLTGQPVMHYISLNGQYLGSMTRQTLSDGSESVFWTLPTDAESIRQRWPDAQLSLPTEKERGVVSDSSSAKVAPGTPARTPAVAPSPSTRRSR